jgi:hypothetical protein
MWGFGNLVVAYLLLCQVGHFDLRDFENAAALGFGILVMSFATARHFGRFKAMRQISLERSSPLAPSFGSAAWDFANFGTGQCGQTFG